MIRLRHVAAINPGTPGFDQLESSDLVPFVPLEAVWPEGLDLTRLKTKSEVSTGYTRFQEGDIVVPKITPTFQADRSTIARGLDGGVAAGTTELHVVRVRPGVDERYVRYLLSSREFLYGGEAEMIGVAGQKRVPDAWLRDFRVPVTNVMQQRLIADYLDTETARIDALIAKKQRMIDLLRERLRLAPEDSLALLRSGSELVSLKYLVRESDQRRGDDVDRELLSVSIHLGVVPRTEASDKESRADDFSNYKKCENGDIVINRMRAFQGAVGVANSPGIVSPDYTVLQLGPRLRSDYVHYLMRSHWFIGEMASRIRGIGAVDQGQVRTPRVNFTDLREIAVPVPPLDEQARLVQSWQAQEAGVSTIVEKLGHQVDLLREHRQALITAAVTGELKIPGVAA